MSAVATVRKASTVPFVTCGDIKLLLGCKENKAYEVIRKTNQHAKAKGKYAFPQGKANKYIFSELYGIPVDIIDRVIEGEEGL